VGSVLPEPSGGSSREGERGAGDHFEQGITDARSISTAAGHRFAFRATASRRTGQGDHVAPPHRRATRCAPTASGADPARLGRTRDTAALVRLSCPARPRSAAVSRAGLPRITVVRRDCSFRLDAGAMRDADHGKRRIAGYDNADVRPCSERAARARGEQALGTVRVGGGHPGARPSRSRAGGRLRIRRGRTYRWSASG
jgi:hypothetical protein